MEKLTKRSLKPERKIEQMSSTVIELVRSCTLLDELVQITDLVELCEVSNDWGERGRNEEIGLLGQGQLLGMAICKQI